MSSCPPLRWLVVQQLRPLQPQRKVLHHASQTEASEETGNVLEDLARSILLPENLSDDDFTSSLSSAVMPQKHGSCQIILTKEVIGAQKIRQVSHNKGVWIDWFIWEMLRVRKKKNTLNSRVEPTPGLACRDHSEGIIFNIYRKIRVQFRELLNGVVYQKKSVSYGPNCRISVLNHFKKWHYWKAFSRITTKNNCNSINM